MVEHNKHTRKLPKFPGVFWQDHASYSREWKSARLREKHKIYSKGKSMQQKLHPKRKCFFLQPQRLSRFNPIFSLHSFAVTGRRQVQHQGLHTLGYNFKPILEFLHFSAAHARTIQVKNRGSLHAVYNCTS